MTDDLMGRPGDVNSAMRANPQTEPVSNTEPKPHATAAESGSSPDRPSPSTLTAEPIERIRIVTNEYLSGLISDNQKYIDQLCDMAKRTLAAEKENEVLREQNFAMNKTIVEGKDGYALVPLEPSVAMIEAGYKAIGESHYSNGKQMGWAEHAIHVYKAMLDARKV